MAISLGKLRTPALGLAGYVGGKWLHEKLLEPAVNSYIPLSAKDQQLIFNAVGIFWGAAFLDRFVGKEVVMGYLIWNMARATKNLLSRFNLESYVPVQIPY